MSLEIDMIDIDELKLKVEKFLNDNSVNNLRHTKTLISRPQEQNTATKLKTPIKKLNSNLIYLTGVPKVNKTKESPVSIKKCTNLDLNEKDLKILLQYFYKLEGEEQQVLISHLKKLEINNPEFVNNLKEFARVTPPEQNENLNDTNELEILDELDDILQVTESDNNVAKNEDIKETKPETDGKICENTGVKSETETVECVTEEVKCETEKVKCEAETVKSEPEKKKCVVKNVNTNIQKPISKKLLKKQKRKLKLMAQRIQKKELKKESTQKDKTESTTETKSEVVEKKAKIETPAAVNNNKKGKEKKEKKKVNRVRRKPMYNWGQRTYPYHMGYDYRDYREFYHYDTYNMPAYYNNNYYSFADNYYY